MVDSPYYRTPDHDPIGPEAPVPGRRTGKVRRSAPDERSAGGDDWELVWSTDEVLEINWAAAVLQDFGFEIAVRSDGSTLGPPQRFGDGPARIQVAGSARELWTPQKGAARAREILDDAYRDAADEIADDRAGTNLDPDEAEPWPGYWTLRDEVARDLPLEGHRARGREFARRRALVDTEFAERRQRQARAKRTALVMLAVLVAAVLLVIAA